MRVLITGAAGRIGTVLRAGLEFDLRLTDVVEPDGLTADETFVAADLTDAAAVDRAVDGVDAVVHLGAVPDDVRNRGAGHDLRNIPLVVAGRRHRHQLARIGSAGQHGAI